MRTPDLRRLAVAGLAAAAALSSLAFTPTPGFEAVERTERTYFAIQCIRADASSPTCDSTNYALSRLPGDSGVGNLADLTPVGWSEGGRSIGFAADDTMADSYVLRGDSTITGEVVLTGYQGITLAGDSTVEVSLYASDLEGGFVTLGAASVNEPVVAGVGDGVAYAFEITVPAGLEGVEITGLNADVKIGAVSVLTWGFVDGRGGSFFDLPYYELVPTESTESAE